MIFAKVLALIFLFIIFIQDHKKHRVYFPLFPAVCLLLIFIELKSGGNWINLCIDSGVNLLFIFMLYALMTIFLSITRKKLIDLNKGYFHTGDLLLWISVSTYFPPLNYFVFLFSSLFIVSLFWFIYQLQSVAKQKYLPLAGYQALVFAIILVVEWINPNLKLGNEEWFIDQFI